MKSLFAWSQEAQRNIEFILQQQAKFSADVERVQEIQARTARVVDELATVSFRRFRGVEGDVNNLDAKMTALVDSHIRSDEAHERLESKMDALADSHIRLNEAHERLAESQKKSDERLDAFIKAVERLITERRNGGQGSGGF